MKSLLGSRSKLETMANIRFVKPPPDNRIRTFPLNLGQPENQSQTITGLEPMETSPTLHITTPKRRKDHLPQWDIFITSKRKVDSVEEATSLPSTPGHSDPMETAQAATQNQYHLSQNVVEQAQDIPQATQQLQRDNTVIDAKVNIETSKMTKHNSKEAFSDNFLVGKNPGVDDVDSELDTKKHESISTVSTCNDENLASTSSGSSQFDNPPPLASKGWVGENKQTKTNTSTTTPHSTPHKEGTTAGRQCIGLSDVSEDEISCLPEVRGPTICTISSDDKQQDHDQQNSLPNTEKLSQNETDHHCNTYETTVLGIKPLPKHMATRNDSNLSLIGLPRRPYPMGPLRRSISEYDFSYENPYDDEDNEDLSFFSRMKTSKHNKPIRQDLQESKTDSLGQSTPSKIQRNGPFLVPRYAWTERTVMKSEIFGGSDLALSSKERSRQGSQESVVSFRELSGPSNQVENFTATDRGRLFSARLTMRRFALADPERMIISQELREKLERDVERRKSSKVRKVSQFFNIQLGLNKEEDLI